MATQNNPQESGDSAKAAAGATGAPATGQESSQAGSQSAQSINIQAEIAKAKVQWEADAKAKAEEEKLKAQGEFQKIAENKDAELQKVRAELSQTRIRSEIFSSAAADAVDADTVHALLSHKAVVADDGKITIDGKPVKEAVAQLLKEKPFLAKATGNQGSGAPHSTQGSAKQMSRADFSKLTPVEQMEFAKTGVITD